MKHNVIDSHLHVWDLSASEYAWLTPDLGALHRSFLPAEAFEALDAAGVESAILVQAEDSTRDTRYLLDVAAASERVLGVVGWVQLDDSAAAERQLVDLEAETALVGIRHLVHDDPRDDFLALPAVRTSLALLADRGLTFDVPNAWPRHLDSVCDLADSVPELTIVIDHLGKPPVDADEMQAWEKVLRRAADRPNVVAKLSGLHHPGQPVTTDALRPAFDVALDAFGGSRLMYGGDWPMSIAEGGYAATWPVMSTLIGTLSNTEQAQVLHSNARTVYRLGDPR